MLSLQTYVICFGLGHTNDSRIPTTDHSGYNVTESPCQNYSHTDCSLRQKVGDRPAGQDSDHE